MPKLDKNLYNGIVTFIEAFSLEKGDNVKKNNEGELYKTIKCHGRTFDIYFGYYSESERRLWSPTPIFPNFASSAEYTENGEPFVTSEQDVCDQYKPKDKISGENWCADCIYFEACEEIIGVCRCEERKKVCAR